MADATPKTPQPGSSKTAAPTEAPPATDQPPATTPPANSAALDFDQTLDQCCASAPYLCTTFELVRALGHALNPS